MVGRPLGVARHPGDGWWLLLQAPPFCGAPRKRRLAMGKKLHPLPRGLCGLRGSPVPLKPHADTAFHSEWKG